ncbi:MAG TPA: hypothetical protein VK623_09550 [Flavobacterium sp.]|nr:hypothetical protein [Flavobacterium sp.]
MYEDELAEIEEKTAAFEQQLEANGFDSTDINNFDDDFYKLVDQYYELEDGIEDFGNQGMKSTYKQLGKRLREIVTETEIYDDGHYGGLFRGDQTYSSTKEQMYDMMFPNREPGEEDDETFSDDFFDRD